MQDLLKIPAKAAYRERVAALGGHGIGLWDVLKNCEREGSLDSAIRDEEANDFSNLQEVAPDIQALIFNGQKAAKSFVRNRLELVGVELITLPSTSPANAGMRYEELLERWRVVERYVVAEGR